jgi:hypothetical protein
VFTDMLNQSNRSITQEQPLLRLALAGFNAAEQGALCVVLAQRAARRRIQWQLAQPGEADAWFVNGARVQQLPDGTLRIMPGVASGRAIRINLEDLDWPIAFSMPVGPPDFKPSYSFEAGSPASVEAVLDQIEGWARPLMVQFHLASHLVQSELDLRSGVYHVTINGKLVAMVSPRSGVGVWGLAEPAHMKHAVWSHRPESADAIPGFFVRIDFADLMWQYAIRTTRDCLPAHYRSRTLYLRRPPKVAMRLMTDACLLLVRELGAAAGTLAELSQRTGMPVQQLSPHVGALYLVGAITSDAKRAGRPQGTAEPTSWTTSSPADSALVAAGNEMTVRLKVAGRPAPNEETR